MGTIDLQSTNESGMLYYDHQLIKGQLDGLDDSNSINDKLNGITNEINNKTTIIKNYSSSAEYSVSNNSVIWRDTDKAFQLNGVLNYNISKIFLKADLRLSDTNNTTKLLTAIKFTGTNTGTLYAYVKGYSRYTGSGQYFEPSYYFEISNSIGTNFIIAGDRAASFETLGSFQNAMQSPTNKLLDDNITCNVIIYHATTGRTLYIKNVELYLELINSEEQ